MFLLNVLDEVRHLVKESRTATAGEALGVTALQMMAVLVSDSRDNIRLVMRILSHLCAYIILFFVYYFIEIVMIFYRNSFLHPLITNEIAQASMAF